MTMPKTHEISSYAMKNLIRDYVIAEETVYYYEDLLERVPYEDMSITEHEEFEKAEAIVDTSLAWMSAIGISSGSAYVHNIRREILSGKTKE